jgi:predicted DNA binding CopG/RHH family protein
MERKQMKREYDFSEARPGRFAHKGKQQITIRIEADTISYFKDLAQTTGVPYQTLMNLFLTECAHDKRTLGYK